MNVRRKSFMAMRLTFLLLASIYVVGGTSSASDIPRKPTNLQVTNVHNLTITLTWTKPALTKVGTPVTTSLLYKVTYTVIGSGNPQKTMRVTTESAKLNLQGDKTYNIHVRAIRSDNRFVQSDWSDTLRVDSKNLAPGKTANLRVKRWSGLVVYLAWDETRTTINGKPDTSVIWYMIRYRELANTASRQIRLSTNQASLRLLASSRYAVDVRAYKKFIPLVVGPWSDKITLQTNESVPSKPPSNVKAVSNTPSSITVSWDPIPRNGQNGIIQGYVVFYRDQSSSSWTESDVKLDYSLQLTNLVTGKHYTVCVAGYTTVGRGVKSPQLQNIVVGGQLKTTKKTVMPTTLISTSTIKKTTKLSSKSSPLPPKTVLSHTPKTAITEPSKTRPLQLISTLSGMVFSRVPITTKSTDPKPVKETKTVAVTYQSTPAVALVSDLNAKNDSKTGFGNKILLIGVSAAGGLLLLIILILVIVLARRRTRKRRQLDTGEIPLHQSNDSRQRSNDVVTRGISSIRYEPPQSHFRLAGESMTEQLLSNSPHDAGQAAVATFKPRGSFASAKLKDENTLLLPTEDYPEESNEGKGNVEDGSASRLYDTIGCPPGNSKNAVKSDAGQRYVTRDQMVGSPGKCPLAIPAQAPPQENGRFERCNEVTASASPQGHIYQNVQESEHLYDTLNTVREERPYENTRVLSNPPGNNSDKDGGYEPIPFT